MKSSSADMLAALAAHVDEVIGGVLREGLDLESEADLVATLTTSGAMLRRIEGLLVEATGQVAARSGSVDRELRLTTRFGCHDVSELVQRATLVGPQTASRLQRASRAVRCETALVTGELLPAAFPGMREALRRGDVGVDALLAVAGPLGDIERRVGRDALLVADAELSASARGEGADASPPACADLLRVQATAWAVALDQDGSAPREREALHRRSVTLGAPTGGLVPIRGSLLPEVAAQLQRIFDALCSPRGADDTGGVRFTPEREGLPHPAADDGVHLDERRAPQRRHDALATALGAAASSATLPTVGGAAPTLVVSVRESDLRAARGWAHADGCDEPLPIGAAHHTGCAGVVQRVVLGDAGRIVRIGTEERVFNRHQRRAISLRDGGCIIPGCGVPAAWCEIHHVAEHAHGGATHTDNGVLLCWFHHRFLEWHQWKIRMNRGVPEVRAPSWNDASGRWRAVTTSRSRLADSVIRRM